MSILVCGGAGYIGSHTVNELVRQGKEVVVLDNLNTGHVEAVDKKATALLCDIRRKNHLSTIMKEYEVDSVIHFAANSLVAESMTHPLMYFDNNVHGMQVLLQCMVENDIKKIVFSSSCAVYGRPHQLPINEEHPTNPISPYGESKLIMERMMRWVKEAHDVNYVSLRYFNAAGASFDGLNGEDHEPESHLIPLVLKSVLNKSSRVKVYGDNYDTPDGTCIRDYIHVLDLADAHIRALEYLNSGNSSIINLGTGKGTSVKEIITTTEKVVRDKIPYDIHSPREGDPDILVADNYKAKEVLGWTPKYSDIKTIISSAWKWHKNHPNGFAN